MHICFITHEYPKNGFPHGGLGSFVKTISHELTKIGIKVSIVGMNYENNNEEIAENNINVYRLKKNNIKGLSWYLNSKAINNKIKQIHSINPINIIESSELGLAFLNKIESIKYIIRLAHAINMSSAVLLS